ncbi:hypothetical protein, partial [Nocardioides pakistanensis]
VVWFDISSDGPTETWQQTYDVAANDVDITLTGDPIRVSAVTTYVPVNSPAGRSTTTEESEEDTMGNIQIDEAEHRSLVERAGRVDTLESERDTAVRERDEIRRERDELRAREAATTRARARVTEANANLAPATVERIVAEATRTVPLTESGQLDETRLDTAVDAARTAEERYLAGLAESAGAGRITGFGSTPDGSGSVSEAEFDEIFDTKGA